MKKNILAALLLFSGNASASALLDIGGTYISDASATPSTQKSTSYFYNFGALLKLKKSIWAGWNYSGISISDTTTATTAFSSTDTGPYLKWQFGRHELFSVSLAYNFLSSATFSDGGTRENWTGTSYWLQCGVAPEVREGLHVGVSFNYYSASYTKKVVSSIESSATNSKTWIFPTLMITKEW